MSKVSVRRAHTTSKQLAPHRSADSAVARTLIGILVIEHLVQHPVGSESLRQASHVVQGAPSCSGHVLIVHGHHLGLSLELCHRTLDLRHIHHVVGVRHSLQRNATR